MSLTVGILTGVLLRYFRVSALDSVIKSSFQDIFMIVLLPPVLYASALKMNKFYFLKNIGCITFYAFLGTLIAILVNTLLMYLASVFRIGLYLPFHYCFVFSTMISSTDPVSILAVFDNLSVDKNLYSIIFGESILNDAITLSFFHAIYANNDLEKKSEVGFILETLAKFCVIIVVSILIGTGIGVTACYLLKRLNKRAKMTEESLAVEQTSFDAGERRGVQVVNRHRGSIMPEEEFRRSEQSQLTEISLAEVRGEAAGQQPVPEDIPKRKNSENSGEQLQMTNSELAADGQSAAALTGAFTRNRRAHRQPRHRRRSNRRTQKLVQQDHHPANQHHDRLPVPRLPPRRSSLTRVLSFQASSRSFSAE